MSVFGIKMGSSNFNLYMNVRDTYQILFYNISKFFFNLARVLKYFHKDTQQMICYRTSPLKNLSNKNK